MNFLELAKQVLEEAQMEADEIDCACNTRGGPCRWCWDLSMAIGALEDAIKVHTP